MPRSQPSLKARAIGFLSRREHSRVELERKLAPHATDADQLSQLLDQLQHDNWLSDDRFAQSLIHRRAPLRGAASIAQELRQHGLADEQIAPLAEALRSTELDRARAVWQRKFGLRPETTGDYARQFRFLASRGFAPDCLRRILDEIGRGSR